MILLATIDTAAANLVPDGAPPGVNSSTHLAMRPCLRRNGQVTISRRRSRQNAAETPDRGCVATYAQFLPPSPSVLSIFNRLDICASWHVPCYLWARPSGRRVLNASCRHPTEAGCRRSSGRCVLGDSEPRQGAQDPFEVDLQG